MGDQIQSSNEPVPRATFVLHRGLPASISGPTPTPKTTRRTSKKTVSSRRSSRKTQDISTALNHGNTNPVARPNSNKRRKNVKAELNSYKQNDPKLIGTFFGNYILNDIPGYESLMSKLYDNGQWSDMLLSGKVVERTSNEKFLTLLDKIKDHFTLSRKRGFRDTQYAHYLPRNGDSEHWLSPDIAFWGNHTNSFPETSDESSPTSKEADFKWCIAILEGKLDQTRKDEDDDQLASYVREVFSAQFNRRFVPSFVFTQSRLKFYLFDRSGVFCSEDFNYHNEPRKFVGIIRSLLEWDEGRLGFDRTITREANQWFITTYPVEQGGIRTRQRYIVVETLFHTTALVGDCPTCWLVKKEDEYSEVYYFIKDAWVFEGSSNEGDLLEKVSSQQGVATVVSYEDVLTEPANQKDSILNIRSGSSSGDNSDLPEDRVHTRIVMRLTGRAKPLEQFSTRVELLAAFRDAIAGHLNLYTSGILHRDVTPFCILIQPDADIGNRGILFDLHCAVSAKSAPGHGDNLDSLFPIVPADRLGSRAFQCFQPLDYDPTAPNPPHYTHDLESFYYVLCYMISCHQGPGPEMVSPTPTTIQQWFGNRSDQSKSSFLWCKKFPIAVPSYFGSHVETLLQNLHTFISRQVEGSTSTPWSPGGVQDYITILEYLDNAITAIENEDNNKRPSSTILQSQPRPKQRKCN